MWPFQRKQRADLDALRVGIAHFVDDQRAELEKLRADCLRAVPMRRLETLELELVELRDLHDELMKSHKRLRSRQGMRELREGNGHAPSLEELERKHGLRR